MKFQKDGFSVEAAIEKGRDLPKWYLDEPYVNETNMFYLQAFYDLSTCRHIGQVVGPIPWNVIIQYGEYVGLNSEMLDIFTRVIRSLDSAYLEWDKQEVKKIRNAGISNKSKNRF